MFPVPPRPVVYIFDFKVGVVSILALGTFSLLVVTLPDGYTWYVS